MGPRAMLVLILVLAGLDVAAPQHMSAGVENKAGATIPSFAISGRDAVVAVHGLNFCPGGPRCEHCDFDPPQQLCGFGGGDDVVRFIMRYVDESHVACDVTAGESAKLLGFASASYSQNDGADWTHLDRSDNLATVNWATAPVTRRAIAPFPPAGIPVTLQGENTVPDVHVARVGCAFDGGPPADGGDASESTQLSSTLTRCEPPRETGRPTVRVAVEPLGTRGAGGMDASVGGGGGASWTPTPWVIPTRVSTGAADSDEGSASAAAAAAAEGGGGSLTVEVSVWDDARGGGGVDADAARERFEASFDTVGCRFGTIRVASRTTRSPPPPRSSGQSGAATSDVPRPIDRAPLVPHGALECVAPALVAGRTVSFAAGAAHAELPHRSGLIVVGDGSSRSGGAGVAAPGPTTALAGARSSGSAANVGETGVVLLVGSFAPSRGLALECGVAGRGFEPSSDQSSGRSSGSDSGHDDDDPSDDDTRVDSHRPAETRGASRIGYACTPGAIPRGGFYRLAAWPAAAAVNAGDRWSSSLTSWFDVVAIGVELRVAEEPSVLSHHPLAIAAGDAHANVPLTIVGVNLPGGGSGAGGGPTGAGQTTEDSDARCVGVVGRGERGERVASVSAVAVAVSSAVMICPPFDWVDDRDVGAGAGGSALTVEVGWNGVASSSPTSSASTSVDIEILRIPAGPNGVTPTSTSASGGGVITVAWSEDRSEGDALFVGATCAFGTVSGIPARMSAKTATETAVTDAIKRHKTPQPTCVAPATGAARVGVPVRVSWRSKASRVVGSIAFAPPAAPTTPLALKPAPPPTDAGGTVVAAAATASYPAAFAASGGSLASVRTQPAWSPRHGGRLSIRCAFFGLPGGARPVVSYSARVVSSAVATCETPAVPVVGSGGAVALVSGRSAGAGGWDVEAAVAAAIAESAKASAVAWIETPAVFDVLPRVASVAGGRAITARGRSFGVAERVGVWVGTIGPLRARSIDDDDDDAGSGAGAGAQTNGGDVLEFFAPAGYVGAIVRPVSVGATGATRSGIEPGTAGLRYAPAYRCETEESCAGVAPSSVASAAGGEITTALLSGVYDGDATVTGHLWTRAGKRRVSLTSPTPFGDGQSSFTTWRVPAVSGAGWFEVFVNLGSGDRASARILAFPPPRTSSSGLAPHVTPAAGGAIVWLAGADMRANGGAVDGSSNAGVCVVNPYVSGDGSGNVFVGHLRPVSSAIAACETPALPRPLPAVSIAAGVVSYDDDDDDDDDGSGRNRGQNGRRQNRRTKRRRQTRSRRAGCRRRARRRRARAGLGERGVDPAAVRGAWGGDVIVLSLTRDVYAHPRLRPRPRPRPPLLPPLRTPPAGWAGGAAWEPSAP